MRTRIIPENNGRVTDEYYIYQHAIRKWLKTTAEPRHIEGLEGLDLFSAGGVMYEGLTGLPIADILWQTPFGTSHQDWVGKNIAAAIAKTGLSPRYGGNL